MQISLYSRSLGNPVDTSRPLRDKLVRPAIDVELPFPAFAGRATALVVRALRVRHSPNAFAGGDVAFDAGAFAIRPARRAFAGR